MSTPRYGYATASRLAINWMVSCWIALLLVACSNSDDRSQFGSSVRAEPATNPTSAFGRPVLEQNQILQAQASGLSKVEVLFAAKVKKLLADDTQGLPHQRFLLELNNGTTVLVAHDTKYAPKVPINPGDVLVIQGEYVWNKKGGLVHWTHHSDTPRHASGYIEFNGQRYQ